LPAWTTVDAVVLASNRTQRISKNCSFARERLDIPGIFRTAVALRSSGTISAPATLLHSEITKQIIGCFYAVYRELGPGFSEAVLRRAMVIALQQAGLRAEEEVRLQVEFRGMVIGTFYADIVVEGVVLVEIKARPELDSQSVGQLLNYLKAAGGGVGLLLNFGRRAEFSRKIVGNAEMLQPLHSVRTAE
jgi:GxxExxY protein